MNLRPTENDLRQLAVQMIEDLTNGFVDTTSPFEMALIARNKGLKLTLQQGQIVLGLLEDALLWVTWPGPDGDAEYEIAEVPAA